MYCVFLVFNLCDFAVKVARMNLKAQKQTALYTAPPPKKNREAVPVMLIVAANFYCKGTPR